MLALVSVLGGLWVGRVGSNNVTIARQILTILSLKARHATIDVHHPYHHSDPAILLAKCSLCFVTATVLILIVSLQQQYY